MKKKIVKGYRFLKCNLVKKPLLIFQLLKNKEYYAGETCFPEVKERRGKLNNILNQVIHIIKHSEINEYYFLYGLDLNKRKSENYVPYLKFMNKRNELNDLHNNDAISVLRNKVYFSIIAERLGFKTPTILGIFSEGEITSLKGEKRSSLIEFLENRKEVSFFFKSIDGERGDGVFKISMNINDELYLNDDKTTVQNILEMLDEGRFLIQQQLIQNETMNKLYDKAINTLRLVTINKNNEISILQPILRIGTNDMIMDNWSQGGLCVNVIDNEGNLDRYGYYKPGIGTKCDVHPDSNIRFAAFTIPDYKKAVSQAKQLHRFFPEIHSIGWDICFTPDGIVFIEGNDNWAINIHQSMKGLAKEFDRFF